MPSIRHRPFVRFFYFQHVAAIARGAIRSTCSIRLHRYSIHRRIQLPPRAVTVSRGISCARAHVRVSVRVRVHHAHRNNLAVKLGRATYINIHLVFNYAS